MKILAKVINKKLEANLHEIEEQCGFTAGRSCVDHIFTLRKLLEEHRDIGKRICLVFIDLEKAYDSVAWKNYG